ncbi:actin-related protein 9 isoform X1 [Dendrobium catenatum]|uniref:actin-related protein 9 isoform X1 n=1 Tax=Dendrobium catenatum TaxID=906689 RepID=UPI0009F5595D|nr:actin-related protein 9 isoform X1 [Dendrobium catenatum]
MDYLKSVVPSQLIAERGSNLVVINPGSANVRIGFAHQNVPYNIPHCIARRVKSGPKKKVQDQMLNTQATPAQNMEREKAYDMIASSLKIPFLHEEATNNSFPRKVGRVDGFAPHQYRNDSPIIWTKVMDKKSNSFAMKDGKATNLHSSEASKSFDGGDSDSDEYKLKESIFGDEALRISPCEPYCLSRPIRRGHFNISQDYPLQQVITDLYVIWDWILVDKLHILPVDRSFYSAVLVLPESFDSREIKEMLSIVLRDLRFSTAVVHQEGLAAAFGNGLSTACVVNIGAQVTSVICIEDGVALPSTIITQPYGGEDISRCLLWVQRYHQAWPSINTDPVMKSIDMLMLNKIKESYCQIREGEFDAVAIVHSCEEGKPAGSHKARLSALNVPPMGLFLPTLFVPEEYPPPPRSGFHDYEDMLEDSWQMDFTRRPDMSDGLYLGSSGGVSMWDTYQVYPKRLKKDELVGLAEAITTSILSTGRIDLQRKLFCSIQIIGGVALTAGLVPVVEERVLHAIPSNEAIDTVEVLQSRSDPSFVSWKGGTILAILDFSRDAWIHREDWIRNGIHIGSGRKYKDSYFLQAQTMCYINT